MSHDPSHITIASCLTFLATYYSGRVYRAIGSQLALTQAEFVVLLCLWQKPALSAAEIIKLSGLARNTVSLAARRLLTSGHISAPNAPRTRRKRCFELSASGRQLVSEMSQRLQERRDTMLEILTPAETKW